MGEANEGNQAPVSLSTKIKQFVYRTEGRLSTLVFCSFMAIGLLLGMTQKARYLTLSPEALINSHHVWTVFTSWIIETNPIIGIFHIGYFFACGIFLEPIQPRVFIQYTLSVATLSILAGVLMQILSYYGTYSESLFITPVVGAAGVAAGHGVMISHLIPDKKIIPGVGIPCRFIPFFSVLISAILTASKTIVRNSHLGLTLCGIYFGWLYIRFYKTDPVTGIKGDPEFTIELFFPRPLRPLVALITSTLSGILNFLGLSREDKSTVQLQNAFITRVNEEEPLLMEQVEKDPEAQIDERLRAYKK